MGIIPFFSLLKYEYTPKITAIILKYNGKIITERRAHAIPMYGNIFTIFFIELSGVTDGSVTKIIDHFILFNLFDMCFYARALSKISKR